ncbi:MAG: PEP-CTERM sorting domain-containing protein [bacterium]|nr:PEP-CTERM sorting domain-containing protein [bacterium]
MLEKKMKTMSIVVVAGLVLALAPLAHAELITNGDFELPGANDANPTGWTVDFNSYGQYDGANRAASGGTYGLHPGHQNGLGGIYQDLTTVNGSTYDVSVWIKSFTTGTSTLGVVIANAKDGGDTITITGTSLTTGSLYDSGKVAYNGTFSTTSTTYSQVTTFQFTAKGTSTRFGLYNAVAGTNSPVDLDDVSVTVVPEPATMSLLALGGLGVLLRRRSRKA